MTAAACIDFLCEALTITQTFTDKGCIHFSRVPRRSDDVLNIAQLSPWSKIGLCALAVATVASIVQGIAWLLGLDFDILSGGGSGILLAISLACLLLLMGADRRPASDFGLFVGPRWKKLWFGGMLVGVASLTVYLGVAMLFGVYRFDTSHVTPYRCLKAVLAAMTSCPLAIVEQIIFSGYLLGILRVRYSRVTAVTVPALMFGLLVQLQISQGLFATPAQLLVVGIFCAATLLGILRLACGSILLPAGMLAGWLMVNRVIGKTHLLVWQPMEPWANWFAPYADPRRGPAMWLMLSVGILAAAIFLWRRGEALVPNLAPAIDANFKRLFPLSNANMLTPIDIWIPQLVRARFRIGIQYLPRLLAALVLSTANTILTLPERLIAPLLLRRRTLADPVFLVGTHRSGTTHLHKLLSLDKQFDTPRTYQANNPHGCLLSGWLVTPLLGAFSPWRRPMDGVRFNILSPQEDEFGVSGMSGQSPLWGMNFPKSQDIYDRYIFTDRLTAEEQDRWKRTYIAFLKRVFFWSSKRPLLKNPYNTARVGVLNEMFPKARFVHICRHPHAVYQSNRHMAKEGHVVTQLQDPNLDDSYATRFPANYRAMEDAFQRDSGQLASDRVACLRFEDLERDPVGVIREVYQKIGLEFTATYQQALEKYLVGISDYRKNRHRELSNEDRATIDAAMGDYLYKWQYAEAGDSDRTSRAA